MLWSPRPAWGGPCRKHERERIGGDKKRPVEKDKGGGVSQSSRAVGDSILRKLGVKRISQEEAGHVGRVSKLVR